MKLFDINNIINPIINYRLFNVVLIKVVNDPKGYINGLFLLTGMAHFDLISIV